MELVLIAFAYLLGCIPSGILIARIFALPDPRSFASGNIGASNLTRLGGKKIGALTLLCDASKAIIPILIAERIFPSAAVLPALVGFAAVLGHCFPIFLKFKGGKGVATSAGALLLLAPLPSLIGLVIWLLIFWWKRITSLAALVSTLAVPMVILATQGFIPLAYISFAIAAVVFFRHSQNIRDIWQGTERSFR